MLSERDQPEIILCTDTFTNEDGETYVGYGFSVFREPDAQPIFTVKDLSTDREAVESLIRSIRDNEVAAVHYEDLIEDFLT